MKDLIEIEIKEIISKRSHNLGNSNQLVEELLEYVKIDEDSGEITLKGNYAEWCIFFGDIILKHQVYIDLNKNQN
jgi:hypothetical protein